MLERKYVHKALEDFKNDVIADAKRNFTADGKSSSGKGLKSLDGEIETFPNSFHLGFTMDDYMEFQDKGVSGTKKKYNTPYSYKTKRPPAKAFDKWAVRRGLAPRDEKGRFQSRQSLNYALAATIFKFGIKPSLFFTNAFEKHFKYIPNKIVEAYGLDVENLMRTTLNAKR